MAKKPNWQNRIISSGEEDADQLLANPFNARIHPQFQQQALEGVLDTIGWVQRVIVNQRTGHVVDGHLRVALAITRGEQVPVDYVDLTEDEEKAILASFDYITSLAVYDKDQLDTLLKQVNSDDARVQELLSKLAEDVGLYKEPPAAPEAQIDRAAELQQKWQCERGQLWEIGKHRLLCGDSTNADDVASVMGGEVADMMWSDPPYGVDYVGKTADALTIENDSADDLPKLLSGAFLTANDNLQDGAAIYIAHPPGALCVTFGNAFIETGWHFHQTLIWVKNTIVLGHSDYHFKHEPLIYGWKGSRADWYGERDKASVFEFDKPQRNGEHPTMKPVELIVHHIKNSSRRDELVYDPFGGSGTTMVACEQLGRQCRMIEIEPKYCAVILERMSAMSIEPRLVE